MKKYLLLTLFVVFITAIISALDAQQPNNQITDIQKQILKKQVDNFLEEKTRKSPQKLLEQINNQNSTTIQKNSSVNILDAFSRESVVSLNQFPESEVHSAINPKDTNNIIVSAILQNVNDGTITCPVYYTKDFGKTWNKSNLYTAPRYKYRQLIGGGDPIFTYDTDGKLYLSWINLFLDSTYNQNQTSFNIQEILFWAYSTDGGVTWARENNDAIGKGRIPYVNGSADYLNTVMYDKQWMATDVSESQYRGNVYTFFYLTENSSTSMAMRTKKAGSNLFTQSSVKVNANYNAIQDATVDVDNKGVVHLGFMGVDSMSSIDYSYMMGIFYTQSKDGGQSIAKPRKLTQIQCPGYSSGQSNNSIEGLRSTDPFPQIICDNTSGKYNKNIYIVWTADGINKMEYNGNDIYFMRSTDGGTTWEPPFILNDDSKNINIEQYHPCISINPDGVIAVFWYDRRDDPDYNLLTNCYMVYSFDGGKTFTNNFRITSHYTDFSTTGFMNNQFSIGEYDHLVTTKNYAIATWADGRSGDGNLNLYAAFVPISLNPQSIPLGVEEIKVISTDFNFLSLYPNPANDIININFELTRPSNIKVEIINETGAVLNSISNKQYYGGVFNIDLRTQNLPNGFYFCKITSDFGYSMKKFVVSR